MAFDIGDQSGANIHNIGRDQYISRRESFLREIAASRTKALGLIWAGVVVFLVGLAIAFFGWFAYAGQITSGSFGQEAFSSFMVFAAGSLINFVGVLLIIAGVVWHIIATARRRRVDREMPPI